MIVPANLQNYGFGRKPARLNLVAGFNGRGNHFELFVCTETMRGMGRYDDPVTQTKPEWLFINEDLRYTVDDLNKCVKRINFFFQLFPLVERTDDDITGWFLKNGSAYDSMG